MTYRGGAQADGGGATAAVASGGIFNLLHVDRESFPRQASFPPQFRLVVVSPSGSLLVATIDHLL